MPTAGRDLMGSGDEDGPSHDHISFSESDDAARTAERYASRYYPTSNSPVHMLPGRRPRRRPDVFGNAVVVSLVAYLIASLRPNLLDPLLVFAIAFGIAFALSAGYGLLVKRNEELHPSVYATNRLEMLPPMTSASRVTRGKSP